MIESGTELFRDADKYDTMCGSLLKYIKAPNQSAVRFLANCYRDAINGVAEFFFAQLRARRTANIKKRDRTIYKIGRLREKYRGLAHRTIEHNRWKG